MFEKHMLEEKCVLVDDDGKPIEKVDYLDDSDSEDEVEPVDNEMVNFLASKSSGVGYDTKSLLEQYRETYGNAEDIYDPYDGDLYECQEIPDHIQSICDNLDIKGMEVGLIRRIQEIRYGVSKGFDTAYWWFLGVGTTFDIFQNIHILYLECGVLRFSGYGVLIFIPLWSLVSAGTDTPYLP
ncbi:hypothetical protein Tco_0599588 [Tanacetum coccineum]